MKNKLIAILLGTVLLLLAALTVGGVNINHVIFGNPDFDPTEAPKEAIQRAWRTDDGQVHLQYTYTAPNYCWTVGDNQQLKIEEDTALLTIVPDISTEQCASALVALTFDRDLDLSAKVEILKVVVEHPLSGAIETNELWIESQEEEIFE